MESDRSPAPTELDSQIYPYPLPPTPAKTRAAPAPGKLCCGSSSSEVLDWFQPWSLPCPRGGPASQNWESPKQVVGPSKTISGAALLGPSWEGGQTPWPQCPPVGAGPPSVYDGDILAPSTPHPQPQLRGPTLLGRGVGKGCSDHRQPGTSLIISSSS